MFPILSGIFLSIYSVQVYCINHARHPIVQFLPDCPPTNSDVLRLHLKVDVLASATAACKNGKKHFVTKNDVDYSIAGTFEQSYVGQDCVFFKKKGVNSYTINVEIGWGENGTTVIKEKQIRTVTCSYDAHGLALTKKKRIWRSFMAPDEQQELVGPENSKASFKMTMVNVMGREVEQTLHMGRKMRLKIEETSGTVKSFRVISCDASNGVVKYAILRAGCGDGLIIKRKKGFRTKGSRAFSPFFMAFKLHGSPALKFECKFTICAESCNGGSCRTENGKPRKRNRRSPRYVLKELAASASAQKVERLYHVAPIDLIHKEDQSDHDSDKLITETNTEATEWMSSGNALVVILSIFGALIIANYWIAMFLCWKYEVK